MINVIRCPAGAMSLWLGCMGKGLDENVPSVYIFSSLLTRFVDSLHHPPLLLLSRAPQYIYTSLPGQPKN